MTPADRDGVDPRVARTREVVLAAAVEVLIDSGFERVSIDEIAERSGVARSTIYRNWPDRTELLAEAFRRAHGHGEHLAVTSSGDLRADLEVMARHLVDKLSSDEWARTVPSLIGVAVHGGQLRDLARSFSEDRQREAEAVFRAAADRGEIRHTDQIESAMVRFAAPFFFRRLISQLPLDDEFVAGQVEATLRQLGATSGGC